MMGSISIRYLILTLGILAGVGSARGQEAVVRSRCAETSDRLKITVEAPNAYPRMGGVVIHFEIVNGNRKAVYLVRKETDEIFIDGDRLVLEAPQPLPLHHGEFDYRFFKILPRRTFRGVFRVPADKIASLDLWNFDVGFGYVFDVSGLFPIPKGTTNPLPLRSLLNRRLTTVLLRGLTVQLK
jgi:hypothetical protein